MYTRYCDRLRAVHDFPTDFAEVIIGQGVHPDSLFEDNSNPARTGVFRGLGQDIRHGVRRLLRRPGLSLVAIVSLGPGIGANTAVFSLVRSMLLEPLPYPDADRLVIFWQPSADQTKDTVIGEW